MVGATLGKASHDRNFGSAFIRYRHTLTSLRTFVTVLDPVVQASMKEGVSLLTEAAEKVGKAARISDIPESTASAEADEAEAVLRSPVSSPQPQPPKRTKQELDRIAAEVRGTIPSIKRALAQIPHDQIMRGSVLISLVGAFELLLSDLLHLFYISYPGALESDDPQYSFNDLRAFETMSDFLTHAIEQKIDQFLRGTLDDWCKFFNRHKIDMRGLCPSWSVFAECFQRRHVLVHNGGRVSKLYLQRVDPDWLAEHTEVRLGTLLSIKPEYLEDALDYFEVAGILLCLESWQQFAPKERDSRRTHFIDLQYECLQEKRWLVAEALGSWAVSKGDLPQDQLLIARINRWLAIKRQGHWSEIAQEVGSFDHSTLAPEYVVGIHALRDNMDALFVVLPRASIPQHFLREWPILDEARGDSRFNSFLTTLSETTTLTDAEVNSLQSTPSHKNSAG